MALIFNIDMHFLYICISTQWDTHWFNCEVTFCSAPSHLSSMRWLIFNSNPRNNLNEMKKLLSSNLFYKCLQSAYPLLRNWCVIFCLCINNISYQYNHTCMITWCKRKTIRITDQLCEEFTGCQRIPLTMNKECEVLMFLCCALETEAFRKTATLPMISNALMLLWHQINETMTIYGRRGSRNSNLRKVEVWWAYMQSV